MTFDLFSALIDSRTGASRVLGDLAADRGWEPSGSTLYEEWDRRNKTAQRDCAGWVPYPALARSALAQTYEALGLRADAAEDLEWVLASLPDWPLWPDVADGLPQLGRQHRIGLLSNVDDDLFRRTRAAPYVENELAMTSQRLQAYKPNARIYSRAQQALGPMVHVATSARDVRGSLESKITVVRLRRPGHRLDPAGPAPPYQAATIADIQRLLERVLDRLDD